MPLSPQHSTQSIIRVALPGQPAFQLRKGEEGISVFDPEVVDPPLTDEEILQSFRPGSLPIRRSIADIERKGLQVVPIEGAAILSDRLRQAHRELRPGTGMTRDQFKKTLRELE